MCRARDRCWPRSWSPAAPGPSGLPTLVLTATFAVGTALPLLVFALAGPRRRRTRLRIPPPAARNSDRRGNHDDRAGRRAGVQPSRDAAARRSRLHGGDAERDWGRRYPAQAEPGWHGERPTGRLRRGFRPAATVRAGARHHRNHPVAQHPGRQTDRPRVVARQGGADRLLGVLVHQLPARHPARRRLVQPVSRRRFRCHRRAHSGVRVRTGSRQCGQRRCRIAHRLSHRARQRLHDLEQLPEPVLAGRVPDRRERHRPAHQIRRGRLRRQPRS